MADNDRRTDYELRERLAGLEATAKTTNEELGKLRPVVHELVSHTTALNLMAEEARDSRAYLVKKLDEIVAKIDPMVVAVAQGATTVAMHIQNCNEIHKASDDRHNKMEEVSDDRHKDNQRRLSRVERSIFIATGGGVAIGAALSWLIPYLLSKTG